MKDKHSRLESLFPSFVWATPFSGPNMTNVIAVPFFFLLAAVLASVTECGHVDAVPDSNRPAVFLHFLISSRNGSTPVIGGIRVNSSLVIAFLDSDGVARDPMGFVGEISSDHPEFRYMYQYEEFFEKLRKKNNDYESELVVEVGCLFVPRLKKCRIVHKIGDDNGPSTFLVWNGTKPVISNDDSDDLNRPANHTWTSNTIRAHQRMALETPADVLRRGATEIHERWSAVYTRVVNAATMYASTLIFEYSPEHPRDLICQLRTAAPLSFFLVLEGPDLEPIVSEEAIGIRECTVATIANVLPPEGYDISQLVCRVLSPVPWNVSIKGPQRMYPESWEGGLVKEYTTGTRYYHLKTLNQMTFAGLIITCAVASFVFAALALMVANVLIARCSVDTSEQTTGWISEDKLCKKCRKKAC